MSTIVATTTTTTTFYVFFIYHYHQYYFGGSHHYFWIMNWNMLTWAVLTFNHRFHWDLAIKKKKQKKNPHKNPHVLGGLLSHATPTSVIVNVLEMKGTNFGHFCLKYLYLSFVAGDWQVLFMDISKPDTNSDSRRMHVYFDVTES